MPHNWRPKAHKWNTFFKCIQHTIYKPRRPEKYKKITLKHNDQVTDPKYAVHGQNQIWVEECHDAIRHDELASKVWEGRNPSLKHTTHMVK